MEQLEIDRMESPFGFFPLLDTNQKYYPDTMDLTKDGEAREYWLNCFEGKYAFHRKQKETINVMHIKRSRKTYFRLG